MQCLSNETKNNRYGQRICLEAWNINANLRALNRDDGSYLPQEYLPLVGKSRLVDKYIRSQVFSFRSPLIKPLDLSVEMLRRECNLCVAIAFIKLNCCGS